MTRSLTTSLTLHNEALVRLKRVQDTDETRYQLSIDSKVVYVSHDELRALQADIDTILECGR